MNNSPAPSQIRNFGQVFVLTSGVLMTAGGVLHALAGLPALVEAMNQASTPEALRITMIVGWVWGGVSLLTLGFVTLLLYSQLRKGERDAFPQGIVIGFCFLVFGAGASVYRFPSPHFLYFAGIGALLLLGLWLDRPRRHLPGATSSQTD